MRCVSSFPAAKQCNPPRGEISVPECVIQSFLPSLAVPGAVVATVNVPDMAIIDAQREAATA